MTVRNIGNCGVSKIAREHLGLRQVADLGLWVLDNSIDSCKYKTKACKKCYNLKCLIYKGFRAAWVAGGKDSRAWQGATSEAFDGLRRVRLCTRGEAFEDVTQVDRVARWIADNPNTKYWIPTRAWRNSSMREYLEKKIMPLKNARLQASLDRYTIQHYESLKASGWSTMYFDHENLDPNFDNAVKCRKTWDKLINPKTGRTIGRKAVCQRCRKGCFSDTRVDIWLKYHK